MTAQTVGYSRLSIALHWLTAIAVVALFLTHEGERGSAMRNFHVGGGAIIGVFLIWRVWRRLALGFAEKPQQPYALNFLATSVFWGLLGSIVVVVVTGYLLPWSLGRPLEIYGLAIASPLPAMPWLHEAVEEVHDIAGHLFIPLVALHIAGAVKHALLDEDRSVVQRMALPVEDGR
jgi:cytochrome b561